MTPSLSRTVNFMPGRRRSRSRGPRGRTSWNLLDSVTVSIDLQKLYRSMDCKSTSPTADASVDRRRLLTARRAGATIGPSRQPKETPMSDRAVTPRGIKQLEFLQKKGVKFLRRVNHGMTHSVYIEDPDGHGIEVLYELPREVWAHDIDGAQNYAERLPTEGPEALVDTTDNPVFGSAKVSA